MKILFFLLAALVLSCKESTNSRSNLNKNPTQADTLETELIGKWGGLGEDSPVWEISKDSIYYFERAAAYPYKLIDNDFVIYLPESKGKLRNIRVIKDTLFFLDEQGLTVKGYRFKDRGR